jgi:hypothetical protein
MTGAEDRADRHGGKFAGTGWRSADREQNGLQRKRIGRHQRHDRP